LLNLLRDKAAQTPFCSLAIDRIGSRSQQLHEFSLNGRIYNGGLSREHGEVFLEEGFGDRHFFNAPPSCAVEPH
jgi:hypothetical protein